MDVMNPQSSDVESTDTLPDIPRAVVALVRTAQDRSPLGTEVGVHELHRPSATGGRASYHNRVEKEGIDFKVEKLDFPYAQTMDPRVVTIAPGAVNERHRHAHESIFVILEGRGLVRVGSQWVPVQAGDVAFVPRWITHQTRNTSDSEPLRMVAITDFGFTSAVLGDYDRKTRLKEAGVDALPSTITE
jgi:quercetin dioxygenase-like cupin family protein